MEKETNSIIDSFQFKSNEITSLLVKLPIAIKSSISLLNSSNDNTELPSLLSELNALMLNDDLITLVKDQQYELISLNNKYSAAMEEIAHLEDERDTLSERIQTISLNQNQEQDQNQQGEKENEDNKIELYTVSLSDYNNLKEDYLQLYSRNQSHEQKYEEYKSIIDSYQRSKENLYLITYSYEGLQQECESKYKELNERIASLIEENSDLKDQIKEKHKHCSIFETEKNDTNAKINTLNKKNRVSASRLKSLEKMNSLFENSNSLLKSKLIKAKEENEKVIEEMKSRIQELEEKTICLINDKRSMSKDICKEFLQNFENKNLSFHYIPADNIIAVYFAEERIGEVRNKSMTSIKRNQSNKIVLKYKYLLTDYPEVDTLLCQKKKEANKISLDENTLRHLNSVDDDCCGENNFFSERRSSKLKYNHLNNLMSWDFDNKLTFANRDFCKLESINTNHLKQMSSNTTDLIQNLTEHDNGEAEAEVDEDDESNISDINEETITPGKEDNEMPKKEDEDKEEEELGNNILPKNRIDINNMTSLLLHRKEKQKHDKYYARNYYDVNNTHIEEGDINQVICQDTKKENKCFYCLIF